MAQFTSETRVTSWNQLVEVLHARTIVEPRPSEGGHLRSPYVFRGSDDSTWELKTSLGRLPGISHLNSKIVERSLIRSFRKYAKAGTFDEESEWYVMAVGQHNGLPTRCLDWTASPLVAVHFACADEAHKLKDGVVWCLHAPRLRDINVSSHSSAKSLVGMAWVHDTRLLEDEFPNLDALDATFDVQLQEPRLMLMWEPPSLDDRIANQSGLLTLLNSSTGSQQDFLADYSARHRELVHRVVIAASAKPEIRDMLDQNNISERTLFPGPPGLCAWLRRHYGKAW